MNNIEKHFEKVIRYTIKDKDEINTIINNVRNNINNIVDQQKIKQLDTPIYDINTDMDAIVDIIKQKTQQLDNAIISIAGGTASGKSTIADFIKKRFGDDILIISMDDYYYGKTFMDNELKKGNVLNWDQPEALNLDLFEQHLTKLKSGIEIEKPIYNMKISEVIGTEKIMPKKIILIDGLFALNNRLKNYSDIKIFIYASVYSRAIRRLNRDVFRKGFKPKDILRYFFDVTEPMYQRYIESTKQNADFIITNEYRTDKEKFCVGNI